MTTEPKRTGRIQAKPVLVSFSGIDGSGKSSQIRALMEYLRGFGARVRLIAFWDDVATLTRLRESAGHALFHGERGVGSPEAPVKRRDKNVRSPLMSAVRSVLYFLDTLSLRRKLREAEGSGADWIICDRYLYDELANLNLRNPAARNYARTLARIAPKPDIGYLLDAEPLDACARKPEYPVEFVKSSRAAYFDLNQLLGEPMTVIQPMRLEEVSREVLQYARTIQNSRY